MGKASVCYQSLRWGWQGAVLVCKARAGPELSWASSSSQRIQLQRIAIFRGRFSLRVHLQPLCPRLPSSNSSLYFSSSTFQRSDMT